jgi:PAS domain S-box-containing protein
MVVDQSLEGIVIAQGSPTRLVFANPMIAKMVGYTPDELTALPPKEIEGLVRPEDRAAFFGRFSDRLQGKPVPLRYEVRGIRKDGEERWLEISSSRIEYNGQPAVQATFVDITERKRAEEKLRQSVENYYSLFDRTLDGIYRSTHAGKFVDVNPAFVKMFGYSSKQEMLSVDIRKELYFSPEERGSDFLDTGQEEVEAFRMRRKDGSEIWVEDHGHYIRDERGNVIYHEGILRDVTERKRMEEELRHHNERLEELQKHAAQLSLANSVTEITTHTLDAMEVALRFDHADVRVVEGGWLRCKGARGMKMLNADLPLDGRGVTVKAANSKKTVRVLDTRKEPSYVDRLGTNCQRSPTMLSELAVPVLVEGETFAVLNVESTQLNVIKNDDQTLLEMLAMHVASDILRLRDREALQRQSTNLEQLVVERTKELSSARKRLEYVIHSNPAVLYLQEPLPDFSDTFSTFVSDSALSVLGFEPKNFLGESGLEFWRSRIHPDDLTRYLAEMPSLWRDGQHTFEYRFLHGDGTYRWIREEYRVTRDADEHILDIVSVAIDVTDRKRMEEELRSTKERLEYVIQSNPAVIYTGKPLADLSDWVLTFVSGRVVSILGYGAEEFVGHLEFWISHVHPDDLRVEPEAVQALWRKGHHTFEYRFRHKDGSYRWIRDETSVTRDSEGKPVEVYGYWTDITERKRMEEEIESLARLPAENPDPVLRLDKHGIVVLANEASNPVLQDWGTRIGGVAPKSWRDLATDVLSTGQIRSVDLESGGRSYTFLLKPIVEADYVNLYGRDITDRKLSEKALRESEVRYRRLFQSSPIPLLEEDFSGVKEYLDELRGRGVGDFRTYFTEHPEDVAKCSGLVKIVDVNKATLTLYKAKSVSEFVGGLSKVLSRESLDRFKEEIVAIAEGKTRFESEFINQTLAGDTKYTSVIVSVVPAYEDTLAKMLVSVIDLTEYKLMEERLLTSQRLATIGQTAAMVGHDLRNPLQALAGASYLLRKQFENPSEDEKTGGSGAMEIVTMIEESVDYMNKIVSDLQNYAAPIRPELATVSISQLLNETLSTIRIPASVKVSLNLHDAVEKCVVDPALMKRVFTNLITNALQAMPNGGELKIGTQNTVEETLVSFQDTGTGIPETDLPKLFQPFHTTKAQGQGLGLPVCKRLVEAHGGQITVNSTNGKGSTFTVKLPNKPSNEGQ